MDIAKPSEDLKDTTIPEQTMHPTLVRALATGENAETNRQTWEELKSLISPGKPEDKYILVEEIGSGASATVHKAKGIKDGQVVVIKRIEICDDDDTNPYIYEYHWEVQHMKKLSPNPREKCEIPRYYDSYVVDAELWIVMEYIQGESLFDMISWIPLTKQEIATIFYQVLKAVEYMHSNGVMHNDITFNNVMLAKNNGVKLIDLGMSTEIQECMKDAYVAVRISAPELLKGEEYDSRTDIWAVGIMLWAVLFRENFYGYAEDDSEFKELMLAHGKPPIPAGEKLDPDMADFLDQCLTVNRHERPSATRLLRHEVFHGVDVHSNATVSTLVTRVTDIMSLSNDVDAL